MRKILFILFCFSPFIHFAQDYSAQWEGHFSYYDITKVVKGNNRIYAASGNAIFTVDVQSNNIEELTTVNGLSGETISTIYYSEIYQLLVIGYENGLIEIVFDNDDNVLTIVDIVDKTSITQENKRINHFNAYQNVIYISTNFGVSLYDLERLEFGDTYFIGAGGAQIEVKETTIFNGFIYAACLDSGGVKKADISSSNLIDYNTWENVTSGNFIDVEINEGKLYVLNANGILYQVINDNLNQLMSFDDVPNEVTSNASNLVVTTKSNVYVYNVDFNLVSNVSVVEDFDTTYKSAVVDSDEVYIASTDFGILKTKITDPVLFEEIHPEGPLRNDLFSLEYFNNDLWCVSGGYNFFFNFIRGDRVFTGISRFKNNKWSNIQYDTISSVIENPRYLAHTAINPRQPNQVFVSSYYSGLIEFDNDTPIQLFNQDNSTLVPFAGNFKLTGTSTFDSNGVLWLINGRVDSPLNKYENGRWTAFDFSKIIAEPTSENGFSEIVINEASGTIFLGSHINGLVGFNENNGNPKIKSLSREDLNMPDPFVTSVALDNNNQLWIGTFRGLRVLYNTSDFFENDDLQVDEIIIEEEGIAKELLFQQYITQIKVDGSNNKWIGTSDAGIFYLSSNGQETIFHFTTANSPLPSNSISDIELDNNNGIVYIATTKGLLTFNSGGSSALQDVSSAYVYPNPVRPGFNFIEDKVKIKDISENVNIKITDIEGNLVAEAQSRINLRHQGYHLEIDGGTAFWNGKNLANNLVASGVYLILISDLDTFETKVLKLMVVR
ncbi:two-component regulator propeller domain-containing protein [Algibacter pectinivorans]|uniref:Two component regulator propeller n=1 Tax=Algibacter pectinivorans TaxID=870482 RepID=A0A1I1N9R8_9FLAO|nr:two-component regulator propeller domain-containing protein [Algibacter pectinivorans]SFC93992.1 Two component regulator propeller [Algibacter pectinivorans]